MHTFNSQIVASKLKSQMHLMFFFHLSHIFVVKVPKHKGIG
jgi:hypothetical protein